MNKNTSIVLITAVAGIMVAGAFAVTMTTVAFADNRDYKDNKDHKDRKSSETATGGNGGIGGAGGAGGVAGKWRHK